MLLQILDNFVMPASAQRSGRESRFLTNAQLDVLHKLEIGQTVVLPFLKFERKDEKTNQLVEVEDRAFQRRHTVYLLNKDKKYTKGVQRYIAAVIEQGDLQGIAIQRVQDAAAPEAK